MPPYQSTIVPSRYSLETVSVWALFMTLIAAVFISIPNIAVPLTTVKTFVLAVGALVTLALYILLRLSRGALFSRRSHLSGRSGFQSLRMRYRQHFRESYLQMLCGDLLSKQTRLALCLWQQFSVR